MSGSFLSIIGFLLSPLSWWNDAVINLPLALLFAWGVAAVYKPAFTIALVIGYWLTNIAGLVLLHIGLRQTISNKPAPPYTRRVLLRDLLISIGYTIAVVALVKFGILKPL